MKYMLLIQQGDTPTPQSPDEWGRLSEEEQNAVYAAYQSINQTPGVSPGVWMQPPETATTVRVQDGKTLTTDRPFVAIKEALGGYLFFEADDLDAAIDLRGAARCSRLVRRHGRAVGAELERFPARVLELGAHVGGDQVAALDSLEAVSP